MRRLIQLATLLALGLIIGAASAQAPSTLPIQRFCEVGNVKPVTQGANATNTFQASYPKCTVTVYYTGTTTKATIFKDNHNTALANPFTANTDGDFIFWAAVGQGYDVVTSAGIPIQFPQAFTYTDIFLSNGSGGGGGAQTIVQVNGTPTTPVSPVNFVNTSSVTWTLTGNQIRANAAGGGTGCDTISNGGDCVSNDPTVDQVIAQPSGTRFGVEFPSVGGQPNKFELDQFGGNSFDSEFNQVSLYSNTRPMDIESANGGNISSYTHTLGDAQWAEFSWDAANNTLMGAGESDVVGLGSQPYPGWSIDAPGTLRVGSANGIVLESNSMGQSGVATTTSLVGSVQFPTAGTAQPIVIQGTLGFAQSYIATYNSGWTQTIDTGGKEPVTTNIQGFASTNSTCGPSPCTWVQVSFQSPQPADEVPPFWSDCNLSTGCTGILPAGPPAGYNQPNFQAPFLLLTISGSACSSGAANGTWPAYHRANTLNPSSGAYDFIIPGVALSNATCTTDHPVITFTPVLGGYGEQAQFIDGSAGPVTAKLIPADAPLNSGLTSSTNAGGLQTGYTSSLQVWVGRADNDTSNGITILPWAGDTINGLSSYTFPASQYAVVHFISDGKHNWYVEAAGTGGGVTSLNSLTGALSVTATSPIVVTPSGSNINVSCPTCGTSTGATVTVNGGSALGTANFNGTTPAAGANGLNVTWQQSGSNVSAEVVGDGNGTHFLSGLGTWIVPPGAVSSVSNSDGTLTISPTTTAVVASLALGHANTWSALQTHSAGINFSGSTSPLQLAGSAGTAGQCLTSAGAGATPTWGTCGGGGGSGTVTDGAGTTTAGLISESTTTLHGIDYNSLLDNGHTLVNTLTYSGIGGMQLTGGTGHFITIAEQAAPANPTAGSERWYADSTTHLMSCITSTGSSCAPSGGGSGFPITLGSTSIAASSTTTTLTGFASIGSAVFAGTGSTQTVVNLSQGTAASAPPANAIQFGAPTSVPTSYNAYLPSAAPSDSGGDTWVVPSGGGTGTWKPYLPQQIQQVVIGASTSSVTFSSIPGTYTSLVVVFSGATDGANEDTPEFQFNSDTAAHYDQAGLYTGTSGFTPGGFGQTAVTNFGVGGILPVYNSSTPFAGGGTCTIANYTGPFYKTIHCESGGWQTTSTVGQLVNTWGQWRGAAAITSVTFFSGLGSNFHPGTTVTLYGLP